MSSKVGRVLNPDSARSRGSEVRPGSGRGSAGGGIARDVGRGGVDPGVGGFKVGDDPVQEADELVPLGGVEPNQKLLARRGCSACRSGRAGGRTGRRAPSAAELAARFGANGLRYLVDFMAGHRDAA